MMIEMASETPPLLKRMEKHTRGERERKKIYAPTRGEKDVHEHSIIDRVTSGPLFSTPASERMRFPRSFNSPFSKRDPSFRAPPYLNL
ncbi:hypothetical protein TNCV_1462081 [Trichonephila clavipes]|nr:hypothetical protein TNCV_1462081 [Trichonephila clavipes]